MRKMRLLVGLLCFGLWMWSPGKAEAGAVYRFKIGGNGKGKEISKGWGRVRRMSVHKGYVYLYSR